MAVTASEHLRLGATVELMGMLAGIRATARKPNLQATIDATRNRRGVGYLEGRKAARPFFLIR